MLSDPESSTTIGETGELRMRYRRSKDSDNDFDPCTKSRTRSRRVGPFGQPLRRCVRSRFDME